MNHLILLHGALGSSHNFDALRPLLQDHFQLHAIDFEGHGAKAPPARPYRMDQLAANILEYLDQNEIEQAWLFGYSMGGYAALCLARNHGSRIKGIFTLNTKFRWSPETAAGEGAFLNPQKIEAKVPKFAAALAAQHGESGWARVCEATAEMMVHLGNAPALRPGDLQGIQTPTRIGVGDRDHMVSLEESIEAYRLLPNAALQVLPDSPHPLDKIPLNPLAAAIIDFAR